MSVTNKSDPGVPPCFRAINICHPTDRNQSGNCWSGVKQEYGDQSCRAECVWVCDALPFGRVRPDTRDAAVVTLLFASPTDWNSAYANVGLFKAFTARSPVVLNKIYKRDSR
ncbi:hypothetical protein CBL_06742 [Carabus blaptoides fortunei]